jgi:hypothetical protein
MIFIAIPVQRWFDSTVASWTPGAKCEVVLQGVPFGIIALLALDVHCKSNFSQSMRSWCLVFRTSKHCADALEVTFQQQGGSKRPAVGIQMKYEHTKPGELTVVMVPACPDESSSALRLGL